jgi:murein DD-endopeptidase MepM/ murein hydrolase activator NlpD
MARTWPWTHGLERTEAAARLSARMRLDEAITEAQSSLEQFSGMAARSLGRHRLAGFLSGFQGLGLRWKWTWNQGPAAWGARIWERVWPNGRVRVTVRVPEQPVPSLPLAWPRLAAHAGLLGLMAALLFAGGLQGVLAQPVQANYGGVSLAWQGLRPADEEEGVLSAYASIPAMPIVLQHPLPGPTDLTPEDVLAQEPAAAPVPARSEVITYTVQEGDTLIGIAVQYGLHIETLYWFNSLKSADLLSIDQELQIPPTDGLNYKVQDGDTLDSVAEAFKVRKGNLIAYVPNDLREPYTLQADQIIFVPGASKPIPHPVVVNSGRPVSFRLSAPAYAALPGGERFSWPAIGHITDGFGWTGTRWHNAIDIAAPWGTPIYAAAAGTVITAGWEKGYGYMVAIDHGEGWETRYGHMAQQPEVAVGQWVDRGQLIGYIGCTGNCTGPHVHFEVRYQGGACNPLDYLQ